MIAPSARKTAWKSAKYLPSNLIGLLRQSGKEENQSGWMRVMQDQTMSLNIAQGQAHTYLLSNGQHAYIGSVGHRKRKCGLKGAYLRFVEHLEDIRKGSDSLKDDVGKKKAKVLVKRGFRVITSEASPAAVHPMPYMNST